MSKKWKYIYLILFLIMLSMTVLFSPVFRIREIETRESSIIPCSDIISNSGLKKGDNLFLSLLKKGNLLSMRFPSSEQLLSSMFVYMDNISVKGIMPGIVEIDYEVKKEVFEINRGNIFLVTDGKGYVLDTRNSHTFGLIRVSGIDISSYSIGSMIEDNDKRFEKALSIYNELHRYDTTYLTAFREYINWIDLSSLNRIALKYDDRILVKFNSNDDLSYQTTSMCVMLSQHIGSYETGILDFNYSNPVFSPD